MQLEISRQAAADLEGIHDYGLLHYGVRRADTYLDTLFSEFSIIAAFPFSRPERREVSPPVRHATIKAHNILYRVSSDRVTILRVLHHSANWGNLL